MHEGAMKTVYVVVVVFSICSNLNDDPQHGTYLFPM